MNFDFAQWLKSELDTRFPGQPVKYIVYSSLDFDRAGGAGTYDKTAEIVAAKDFNPRLAQGRSWLPARLVVLDRNNSGVLEQNELAPFTLSPALRRNDFNGDGHLTPNELWSAVQAAEAWYGVRRTITLGGVRVELIHPRRALGDDATVVYFPAERMAFAATFPALTAPFVGRSSRPSEMATLARTIGALDIDRLLSGEGETFTRSQVADFSRYVTSLVTGVIVGYENGRSLEQLQNGTVIDRFAGTPFAATRDADIVYVYRRTKMLMLDAEGTVLFNRVPTSASLCQSTITCQVTSEDGGGGAAAIGLSVRRWRFGAEVNVSHEINITASGQTWFENRDRRDMLISGLVGYRTAPSQTVNLSVLAGPTVARTSINGASRGGFISNPPLLPYSFSRTAVGITVGADLMVPIGSRMRFTIPMRLTKLRQAPDGGYSTTINLRTGVGLSVSLWQHVN